jgi:hypothetical protein
VIEPKALIRWTYELVAFANEEKGSLFTAADVDPKDYEAHRLPDEPRTPAQVARLRARAKRNLGLLARWQPSKRDDVPSNLVRAAERWLNDPLVRSTHDAHSLTPMDGTLSLSPEGRLEVVPRFRSDDAKFAATFAELTQRDAPALVKQCACDGCGKFLVRLRKGQRGQPKKLCDEHYEESKSTHRKGNRK